MNSKNDSKTIYDESGRLKRERDNAEKMLAYPNLQEIIKDVGYWIHSPTLNSWSVMHLPELPIVSFSYVSTKIVAFLKEDLGLDEVDIKRALSEMIRALNAEMEK